MDNFSPAQYDRFEAYRRHALPKQAVRRVGLATHTRFFFRDDEPWGVQGHTTNYGTASLSARCSDCRWLCKGIRG